MRRGENEICENIFLFLISHSCRLFTLLFNLKGQVNIRKYVFSIFSSLLLEISIYICIFHFDNALSLKGVMYVLKYTDADNTVILIDVDEHFSIKKSHFCFH